MVWMLSTSVTQCSLLLACVMVMLFHTPTIAQTQSSQVECTYTNSTCANCQRPCTSELFPLLPSTCHPSSEELNYIAEDSHPERDPPSVRLRDEIQDMGFEVPLDLLPPNGTLSNGYSIRVYFQEPSAENNITLLRLEDSSTVIEISYENQEIVVHFNGNLVLSLEMPGSGSWKSFLVTFREATVSLHSATNSSSMGISPKDFINYFSAVTIGIGFSGLLQDIIIYDLPIDSITLPAADAAFLPQCYCPTSESNGQCSDADEKTTPRFFSNSTQPTEFAVDDSAMTVWQSRSGETPVALVVGLTTPTLLSKIFVTFQTSQSYQTAVLQFAQSADAEWQDLQYYAVDCMTSFGVSTNATFVNARDVTCLPIVGDSLMFFLAGSEGNTRPIESAADYSHFTGSKVMLVMDGFTNDATSYSIQNFQICPERCLDRTPSCTCSLTSTSTSVATPMTPATSVATPMTPATSVATTMTPATSVATPMTPATMSIISTQDDLLATSSDIITPTSTSAQDMTPLSTSAQDMTALSTSAQDMTALSTSAQDMTPLSTNAQDMTPLSTSVQATSTSAQDVIPMPTNTQDTTPVSSTQDVTPVSTSVQEVTPVSTSTQDVTPVSTSAQDVTPVSTSAQDVTPVSTSAQDVTPVSTSAQDVTPVSTSAQEVTPVSTSAQEVTPVSTSAQDVTLVSTSAQEVTPVSTSAQDVTPVSTSAQEVTPVFTSAQEVTPVSTSAQDVTPVSTSAQDVTPVSTSAQDVTPVSTSAQDVTPVSTSAQEVTPVSTSAQDVTPVSTSAQDVTPVSTSAQDVTPVSTSAQDVTPVSTSAQEVTPVSTSAQDVTPVSTSAQDVTPVSTSAQDVTPMSTSAQEITPVSTSAQDIFSTASTQIGTRVSTSVQEDISATFIVQPSITSLLQVLPSPTSVLLSSAITSPTSGESSSDILTSFTEILPSPQPSQTALLIATPTLPASSSIASSSDSFMEGSGAVEVTSVLAIESTPIPELASSTDFIQPTAVGTAVASSGTSDEMAVSLTSVAGLASSGSTLSTTAGLISSSLGLGPSSVGATVTSSAIRVSDIVSTPLFIVPTPTTFSVLPRPTSRTLDAVSSSSVDAFLVLSTSESASFTDSSSRDSSTMTGTPSQVSTALTSSEEILVMTVTSVFPTTSVAPQSLLSPTLTPTPTEGSGDDLIPTSSSSDGNQPPSVAMSPINTPRSSSGVEQSFSVVASSVTPSVSEGSEQPPVSTESPSPTPTLESDNSLFLTSSIALELLPSLTVIAPSVSEVEQPMTMPISSTPEPARLTASVSPTMTEVGSGDDLLSTSTFSSSDSEQSTSFIDSLNATPSASIPDTEQPLSLTLSLSPTPTEGSGNVIISTSSFDITLSSSDTELPSSSTEFRVSASDTEQISSPVITPSPTPTKGSGGGLFPTVSFDASSDSTTPSISEQAGVSVTLSITPSGGSGTSSLETEPTPSLTIATPSTSEQPIILSVTPSPSEGSGDGLFSTTSSLDIAPSSSDRKQTPGLTASISDTQQLLSLSATPTPANTEGSGDGLFPTTIAPSSSDREQTPGLTASTPSISGTQELLSLSATPTPTPATTEGSGDGLFPTTIAPSSSDREQTPGLTASTPSISGTQELLSLSATPTPTPATTEGSGDGLFPTTIAPSSSDREQTPGLTASTPSISDTEQLLSLSATPTPTTTEGSGDGLFPTTIAPSSSDREQTPGLTASTPSISGTQELLSLSTTPTPTTTEGSGDGLFLTSSFDIAPSSSDREQTPGLNASISDTQQLLSLSATPTPTTTEGSGDGLFLTTIAPSSSDREQTPGLTASTPSISDTEQLLSLSATPTPTTTEGSGDGLFPTTIAPSSSDREQTPGLTASTPSISDTEQLLSLSATPTPTTTEGSGDGLFPTTIAPSSSDREQTPTPSISDTQQLLSLSATPTPATTEGSGDGLFPTLSLDITSITITPSAILSTVSPSTEGSGDGIFPTSSIDTIMPSSSANEVPASLTLSFSATPSVESLISAPSPTPSDDGSGDSLFPTPTLTVSSSTVEQSPRLTVSPTPTPSDDGSGSGLLPSSAFAVFSSTVEQSPRLTVSPTPTPSDNGSGSGLLSSSAFAATVEQSPRLTVSPTSTPSDDGSGSGLLPSSAFAVFSSTVEQSPRLTVSPTPTPSDDGSGSGLLPSSAFAVFSSTVEQSPRLTVSPTPTPSDDGSGSGLLPSSAFAVFSSTVEQTPRLTVSPTPTPSDDGSGSGLLPITISSPAASFVFTSVSESVGSSFTLEVSPTPTPGDGGGGASSSPSLSTATVVPIPSFTEGSGDFFTMVDFTPTASELATTSLASPQPSSAATPPASGSIVSPTIETTLISASITASFTASPTPSPFSGSGVGSGSGFGSGSGLGSGSGFGSSSGIPLSDTISPSLSSSFATSSALSISFVLSSPSPSMQFTASLTPSISPSPSPVVDCDLVNSSKPSLPVRVGTIGAIMDQPLQSDDNLTYSTSLATGVRSGVTQPPMVHASLGAFTTTLPLHIDRVGSAQSFNFTVAVSNEEVYFDGPHTIIALQVFDDAYNTVFGADLIVSLMSSSQGHVNYTCSANVQSGRCTVEVIGLPATWFLEASDNRIDLVVMIVESEDRYSVGFLTLKARQPLTFENATYLNLPRRSVLPGEQIELAVHANYTKLLLSFSLDCSLIGAAKVKDVVGEFEWSILPDFFNNSSSRIAVTGFRNYNKSNIRDTVKPDHLFNLTISIDENASSSEVQVTCNAVKLILTTGVDLGPQEVAITDRSGHCTQCNIVVSDPSRPLKLFAYAPQNELLNLAPLTQTTSQVPLDVSIFHENGSFSSINASCSSEADSVIQVTPNCSVAYFSGSESIGSERVDITISYNDLATSMSFRVWYVLPGDITIALEDEELNLISDCSSPTYQQTLVSITADIVTDMLSSLREIILTEQLIDNITTSNDSIAFLSGGSVVGLREGVVNVSLSHLLQPSVALRVSDDPVCLYALDVHTFSDIDVQTSGGILSQVVDISLIQDFQYVNSILYLVGFAVYSDGNGREISEDITFQVGSESLNSSVYVIREPEAELNIVAHWLPASCMPVSGNKTLQIPVIIPELVVRPKSTEITSAPFPGLPTGLSLAINLTYPDSHTVSISDDSKVFLSFPCNVSELNEEGIVVTSTANTDGEVCEIDVEYTLHGIQLNTSVAVTIKRLIGFNLTAYIPSRSNSVEVLKQIGMSGLFQEAHIMATAFFSDGASQDVGSITSIYVALEEAAVSINATKLEAENIIAVTALNYSTNITLSATLESGVNTTENLVILVTDDSVGVESIDNITLQRSAVVNELYMDCVVTLQDQTRLYSTFEDGSPIYQNLINFVADNTSLQYIRVDDHNGTIHMIRNSLQQVSVTAHSITTQKNKSRAFYSNLLPNPAEVDLGSNSIGVKPLNDVIIGESFDFPVVLNSPVAVGVYELVIQHIPSSALKLETAFQGKNWRNGSLIFLDEDGTVTLSGVLVGGSKGADIHLAQLNYMASQAGPVTFSVQISILSEATVQLPNITVDNASVLASQVQMEVLQGTNRRRRSVEEGRGSRRVRRESMQRDYNGDGNTDQRDVYLLQVYLASEVYNFTTDQGSSVIDETGRISDASVNQIASIEMASLGTSFPVVELSYRYYRYSNSAQCMQEISATIRSNDGAPVTSFLRVLLEFSSNNSTFLVSDFMDANFTGAEVLDSAQGIIEPLLMETTNDNAVFNITGNAFTTEEFQVSVIAIVELGGQAVDTVSQIGGIYSEEVVVVNASNIVDSCNEVATTEELTTAEPTTAEATTAEATTAEPTTAEPTTVELTTAEVTTAEPTTAELTTAEATTAEPTTVEETTAEPTEPTTAELTTAEETTAEATTVEPTTAEATTAELTTAEATTAEVTTVEPTTAEPTTAELTTAEATTAEVTTVEPITAEPTTAEATTAEATTAEATTDEATTAEEPTTAELTTAEATTAEATTAEATTAEATTVEATTAEATTAEATTAGATTAEATTAEATTVEATTAEATTTAAEATTAEATTAGPTTAEAATAGATTAGATTAEATTAESTTAEATTAEATTAEATTAEATTTAAEATTAEATTAEATTAEATTAGPTTAEATTAGATTAEATTAESTTAEATTTEATTAEATTAEATTAEATTAGPTTAEATTAGATTAEATTAEPTTAEATTAEATTAEVTTAEATTAKATTAEATTAEATTAELTTAEETTTNAEPTTAEATTTETSTTGSSTTEPSTTEPSTTEPSTTDPSTTEPSTPESSSTEVTTGEAIAATTPELTTAEGTTTAGIQATGPPTTATTQTTSGLSTPTTTNVTATGSPGESSPNIVQPLFGVMAAIAAVLIVVIAVILLLWGMKQRRKKKGVYRPSSNGRFANRGSHQFWCGEEEKIEMNPIESDINIVPLEKNAYDVDLESSMDLVPNHQIYHSERTDSTIFSNLSTMPLVQQPQRQVSHQNIKQSHPTFTDVIIESAPPPYTSATTVTGKTEASASSYEMEEEDDIFEFKFNDDAHTQPYLSLGLTPLSQLSPADPGPTSSNGDSYFFPSMPPPVTPISSVFNMPSSNPGIPVDSPFQIDSGGMVMPEANPVGSVESAAIVSRRTGRRGKHEMSTPSQGYAMKLEPVPELSCSLDDGFGTILNHNAESSSSSAEDPLSHLLSSSQTQLPPHLRRKTGKRRKSGTRRKMDDDDYEGTVMWNKPLRDVVGDSPVKLSLEENSPRQHGRRLRQELREQELERQKQELRQKHLEEEKARLMFQEQRAAQIAQDYGSTRQREVNIDQALSPHRHGRLVLQQAMRFEAQAQLMQNLNLSSSSISPVHGAKPANEPNYIVNTSNQFSVL